jgi:hypothetical protein
MNYLISNYGAGIAVALLNKRDADEHINLAHNLFNSNADYTLFHGVINFPSFKQFKKLLIYKEYFKIWDEHFARNKFGARQKSKDVSFIRRAIKRAKLIIESNVEHRNFMSQIRNGQSNYSVGCYQDEPEEE